MNKNELMKWTAAVLTTLLELDTGTPESMVYIALGMDIEKWEYLRGFLLRTGLISIQMNYVELTDSGKKTAKDFESALAK